MRKILKARSKLKHFGGNRFLKLSGCVIIWKPDFFFLMAVFQNSLTLTHDRFQQIGTDLKNKTCLFKSAALNWEKHPAKMFLRHKSFTHEHNTFMHDFWLQGFCNIRLLGEKSQEAYFLKNCHLQVTFSSNPGPDIVLFQYSVKLRLKNGYLYLIFNSFNIPRAMWSSIRSLLCFLCAEFNPPTINSSFTPTPLSSHVSYIHLCLLNRNIVVTE